MCEMQDFLKRLGSVWQNTELHNKKFHNLYCLSNIIFIIPKNMTRISMGEIKEYIELWSEIIIGRDLEVDDRKRK